MVLTKVDITVAIMSSRSRYCAIFLSIVPSEMPICELSSQGPVARKPMPRVAAGSSGKSTSPATCSRTKRAYGLSLLNDSISQSR